MRIVSITFLFALFSLVVFPQRFDAGFLLGMAATQVDGDGHGGFDKAGAIAGIWVSSKFKSAGFVRTEFRYIQKGSYAKTSTTTFYRMRLNYFELPVIVGYRFNNGFNGFVGLSPGYLARANEMDESDTDYSESESRFKKYEFSGLFGVEYNYSERWKIGALFCYSLIPVRPHPGSLTYRLNYGQYNQVVELVIRYVL